jgi:sarcosine dehydrogenase
VRNAEGVTQEVLTSGSYELVVAQEKVKAHLHLKAVYDPKNLRILS